MSIEYAKLRNAGFHPQTCKHCNADVSAGSGLFMRGMVTSWWRELLGMPYCAVICDYCMRITGWEKP